MDSNSDSFDLKFIENELILFQKMVNKSKLNDQQLNELIDEIFVEKIEDKKVVFNGNNDKSIVKLLLNSIIKLLNILWICFKSLILLIIIIILLSIYSPTQRIILRNSQELIYPVMRQLRLWTLPLMRDKTHLNRWHVEECIVNNPFYMWSRLECWPCDDIRSAQDLSSWHHLTTQYVNNEKPFLVKDVINHSISAQTLIDTYLQNSEALTFGTAKIASNYWPQKDNNLNNLMQVLSDLIISNNKSNENSFETKKDIHIEWKMNRVEAARVIRKVFIRPYFVPNTSEVALERYIYIDGPQSPQYHLPITEFANVWLTQGNGFRHIVLDPSDMCSRNCSTFSVVLRPKDVLYYNWQFYRPRSLPARIPDSDELSITFVASFY
jgi:hypothetical protein